MRKALGDAEIVPITTADGNRGDKSRFVREIERALLDGEIDLAVHSAKDLPSELPDGLEIAGVPERADPRDAYIGHVSPLGKVPEGARIGTSSLRRQAQILARRPDLDVVELHGNVDTRLRRFADGDFDGIVLAAAAVMRLGRGEEISYAIEPEEMVPAPGQGALAIEARHSDDEPVAAAESITDRGALGTLSAERALVAALGGSCNTPLGASASLRPHGRMRLIGFCGLPDGSDWLRDEIEDDASDPEGLGVRLAERMDAAGAREILARAEGMAQTT